MRKGGGAEGTECTLTDAVLELRYGPDDTPEFVIEGRPTNPALAALDIRVAGTMDAGGNINLTGNGSGALGAFYFPQLTLWGRREGVDAVVQLRFQGPVEVPRLASTTLSGERSAKCGLLSAPITCPESTRSMA